MIVWDEDDQCEFDLRHTDARSEEIHAVYSERCEHEITEMRRRVASNGAVSFRNQCLNCGGGPGNAIPKSTIKHPAPDRIPLFDPQIYKDWSARRDERLRAIDQKYIRLQKAGQAEWWRWYDKYLQSTEWRVRRDLVMARAEGVCEGCRSRPAVQVHHLTYDHVGNEFLWELAAVCKPCHDRVHADGEQRRERAA